MRIIRIQGGGNETHSHLERLRSPTRTTFEKFKKPFSEQIVAGTRRLQKILDNFKKLKYNTRMKILIGCEFSGVVRDCFLAMGHEAISCDLLPTEAPGPHIVDDVVKVLYENSWDMAILHPPCTYLAASGLHWNKRQPERALKTEESLKFIEKLWKAPVKHMCIENPVGCISTRLDFMPKPQYVQPYDFGEDASKKTGLWLRNLPALVSSEYVEPRWVDGKPRWGNQSDTGQSRLGGGSGHERSVTYFGIAAAMALQWG